MRWQLEFPVHVYTVDEDGNADAAEATHAPLTVRNAIAEACWSLAQALSRTTSQVTMVASIDGEDMEADNGKKRPR
jgi:hypothetical protein